MCQQKTQYSKWRPWEFTKGLDGKNIHDIEKISETSHSEHSYFQIHNTLKQILTFKNQKIVIKAMLEPHITSLVQVVVSRLLRDQAIT